MRGNIHGGKLNQERICLGVRISKETHIKLLEIAKSRELSLSDVVRGAINDFVRKESEE
jgi:predicted transcriptional regulator